MMICDWTQFPLDHIRIAKLSWGAAKTARCNYRDAPAAARTSKVFTSQGKSDSRFFHRRDVACIHESAFPARSGPGTDRQVELERLRALPRAG